jgi:hypothetical protein
MDRTHTGILVCALLGAAALADRAHGAGSAYQVDTAEVSEPGPCKVESWASWAQNGDFIGAVSPDCVVNLGKPVDLSVQFNRGRIDDEWFTLATPKAKVNLVPTAIGSLGFAVSGQATFDLLTRELAAFAATVPATLRVNNNLRFNLNAGWLYVRPTDRHFATYGAAFDLRTSDNVWTWTAEVFGVAGYADNPHEVQPRFQTGVRFRPIDEFSIDVIYGRNLAGENANWITVATVFRFRVPEK